MWKKVFSVTCAVVLSLGVIGSTVIFASERQTSDNPTVFRSLVGASAVKVEGLTPQEIVDNNREYLEFMRTALGDEAEKRAEADLLAPWREVTSEGLNITIDRVETDIIR